MPTCIPSYCIHDFGEFGGCEGRAAVNLFVMHQKVTAPFENDPHWDRKEALRFTENYETTQQAHAFCLEAGCLATATGSEFRAQSCESHPASVAADLKAGLCYSIVLLACWLDCLLVCSCWCSCFACVFLVSLQVCLFFWLVGCLV